MGKENVDPGVISVLDDSSLPNQQGWKAALDLLLPTKTNSNIQGSSPAQVK